MKRIITLCFLMALVCVKGWGQTTQTFSYTGAAQTFTVPSGVTSLTIKLWGAGGAGGYYASGGSGAFVTGTLAVTSGQVLSIVVGKGGIVPPSATVSLDTAYGGGGAGGFASTYKGGGGGGRSAIQIIGGADAITAGGGGGGGSYFYNYYPRGGGGGATDGYDTYSGPSGSNAGKAGSATAGGAAGTTGAGTSPTAGSSLKGGNGGVSAYCGGAGGGGYFGGGGGSGSGDGSSSAGGGGGSSYIGYSGFSGTNTAGSVGNATSTTTAPGNTDANYVSGVGIGGAYASTVGGSGQVVISYTLPVPIISSFTPSSGCPSTTSVVITGTNFTGATSVKIGGTAVTSFTINSATQITAIIGSGTTGTISITNSYGTGTSAASFTVNAIPSTVSVTPATATICSGIIQQLSASGGTGAASAFSEGFETYPTANFAATGTGVTPSSNTTYYSAGSKSVLLTYASSSTTGAYTGQNNINLSGYTSAQLTFSQICAMESSTTTYDAGYVQYSTDGGTTWTTFPTSSYAGSGTLITSVNSTTTTGVIFSTKSYSDWIAQFTSSSSTPGTGPATSLWKTETINIPAAALTSQFRVRFLVSSDVSVVYYGWLLDNINIIGQGGQTPITWSPITNLYTNSAATTAYTAGNSALTVYAKIPNATSSATNNVYTATATSVSGCTNSATATITVNPPASIASVSGTSPLCIGSTATYTANSVVLGGGTGAWTSSNTAVATVNSSGIVTAVAAGTANIVYTITGGCGGTVSAQQSLTVNPPASIASVSGTTPLCIGSTATYTANSVVLSGGTGAWTSSNTVVATVNSGGTVTAVAAGTANIVYTITGGCGGTVSAQQSLTVNPNTTITLTSAAGTNNQTVCSGTSVTNITYIVASGGTNASVSGLPLGITGSYSGGVFTITGSASVTTTTTYSYTVTTSGGCSQATATGSIKINPLPAIFNLTSGSYSVCYDGTGAPDLKLSGSEANVTYNLLRDGTIVKTITATGTSGVDFGTQSVGGTYTATATNPASTGGCSVNMGGSATIAVAAQIVPYNVSGGTYCGQGYVLLSGSQTSVTYHVVGNPSSLDRIGTGDTLHLTVTASGSYSVVGKSGSCSDDMAGTASVTITPTPSAAISYTGTPFCTSTTSVSPTQTGTAGGTYSSASGLTINSSTGTINPSSSTAGTYTVTYTVAASGGCAVYTTSTTLTISALPTATISGPSSAVCAGSASGVTITNTGTTTETINYTTQISGGTAMPNSIILTSGSGYQPNDVVNSTTTYTITSISNGTCTSSSPSNASVTVTVNQAPVVALISGPGNIAFGKKGTYTEATPGGTWSIVSNPSGDATITSTSTSPDKAVVTAGSSAGTATLSYTVTDGTTTCSTKTDTTINIFNNTITRYRTKQDGYATDFNTWSVLNDNNVWVDATTAPTNNDNIIVRHNLRLQYANYKGAAGTSFDITSHDTTNHVTINGTLTLADTVYFQSNGSVNFNGDSVILLSSSAGTGSIGVMGAAIAGATNVTVQRYTDGKKSTDATGSRRAWRLITSPVTGQTIRQSWQEGGVSTNGYGTLITGEQLDPATAAAQGYDYIGGGNHTSLKHYVIGGDPSGTGGNYWLPLSNTGSTTGTLIPIQNEQAYLLFVRGDRTVGLTGTSPATLRSTGTLQQGDGHAVALTPNSLYTLVGNPYASAIDFGTFIGHNSNAATGIQDKYYSWNSTIGTYGSYVLVDHLGTGGNYEATPVPLTNGSVQQNDNYRFITNGSGFFVLPNSPTTGGSTTSPGSVSFKETDKAPGMVPPISPFRVVTPANERQLLVNLSQKDSDTSLNLADGFRARFSDEYSGNEADNSTAKAANPSENLGLVRSRAAGESDLIIEARADVQKTDTLYMKMWNVSQRSYQLQVQAAGFTTAPGVQAWLQDSYLGTKQAVDLAGGVTSMDFTVTADSGSWRSDRFMIVFTNSSLTLPVTVTKVKAAAQNGGVSVAWTVTNETNIRTYQAEKSADGGITFTAVGTPQAARNNAGAAMTSYSSFDSRAAAGDNLYRIRIEAKDGTVSYSQTVKVTVGGSGTGVQIVLYPNPVRQGRVSVQLTNLAAGTYLVSVYTSGGGQAVYQKKVTITQAGTTQSEELLLGSTVAQGSYEVKITNHNGAVVHQQQLIVGR